MGAVDSVQDSFEKQENQLSKSNKQRTKYTFAEMLENLFRAQHIFFYPSPQRMWIFTSFSIWHIVLKTYTEISFKQNKSEQIILALCCMDFPHCWYKQYPDLMSGLVGRVNIENSCFLWYKELMSKCTTLCYKAAKIPLS
jgi:hypothetical protein